MRIYVVKVTCSDVEEPDAGGGDVQIPVEELGLDHHVAVEHIGGHHLALGRGLDERLPRVVGVGDHVAELEEPLLQAAPLEEDFLLQLKMLHTLAGSEVHLARHDAALEDALRDPRLMLARRARHVLVVLPQDLACISIAQIHPVNLEAT